MTAVPAPRHTPPEVVPHEAEVAPIDLDAWLDLYVATILELEGIKPLADPPIAPVG